MVVVPLGYVAVNGCPSLLVPVMVGLLSQLSVAVAVPGLTCAAQVPGSVLAVMLAGQLIVGFSLSVTVTVWSQDELLPELSVAVQWIVVVPFG
jgi:hypothetical protein